MLFPECNALDLISESELVCCGVCFRSCVCRRQEVESAASCFSRSQIFYLSVEAWKDGEPSRWINEPWPSLHYVSLRHSPEGFWDTTGRHESSLKANPAVRHTKSCSVQTKPSVSLRFWWLLCVQGTDLPEYTVKHKSSRCRDHNTSTCA